MLRFTVPNMTCGGCAKSVTKAIQSLDASAVISTDPSKREVLVDTNAAETAVRLVLAEAGYPANSLAA
ncbi:heavy-metal-associated domain-containing protein [Agrobacterium tumefaciens]|jgi:copper chaperone|uniref:heavy-metal-associated domain-containing protein n=2 Tax=Agrobacterium tumefaciens TaxID=358 RepID=UPI000C8C688E|nr:heavy-metal-associated domain-containing protein [Agrobacterium tumefaciens]MAM41245.1 heavy metal transport/detoxification protein [Erythrobacter sp.]NSZ03258.1 heavy-metal-associated domain-containing protein [Agrobacterium tumefaciens]NSZ36605.1 heavy-metal-associated domain-containing protein [Agrobacterium tumefaciens]NTB24708.1 heavy-metal-associated domain-containing protein [Agrobacterium tumefaciens]NTB27546.1 heavy-metal-associated domain-containing protein [Agrobacterium tumefaci